MPKKLPRRITNALDRARAGLDAAVDRLREHTSNADEWACENDNRTVDDGVAHLWHIIHQLDEHIEDVKRTLEDMEE